MDVFLSILLATVKSFATVFAKAFAKRLLSWIKERTAPIDSRDGSKGSGN